MIGGEIGPSGLILFRCLWVLQQGASTSEGCLLTSDLGSLWLLLTSILETVRISTPTLLVQSLTCSPVDTDIRAGSMYQYKLIWMLALATLMGLLVQFLACKLGLIAQRDLAQQCRQSYPRYLTWFLWVMAEIAIIASDIPVRSPSQHHTSGLE